MRRHLLALTTALTLASPIAGATPAHATGGCAQSALITFTPPLITMPRSGTGTLTNLYTCVTHGGVKTSYNTLPITWNGNCAAATVNMLNWSALLIQGSVLVSVSGSPTGAGTYVFVPNSTCNESSAVGYGFAVGV